MRVFSRGVVRDIIIIFLLSLIPLLWFRPGMLMVGHDLVAPLNPQVFFSGRLFTWIDQFFGQSQALILGTIPIHLVDTIPSFLGFSLDAAQKIVYVFWFFLMGLSAYVLAHILRPKSSLFKLIAAILYQFNFFILQAWWIAEKSKFSAYIAAPLVLGVFLLVEGGNVSVLSGAILNGLILFFFNAGGVYGLPLYGGFFVIIGSYILFSIVEHWYLKDFNAIKKVIFLTISTILVGLAMNAYFIVPAAMKIRTHQSPDVAQIGGVSGVLDWAGQISANASLLNLMRLEGIPDWYDNPEHPYAKVFLKNPILITASFLWALAAFSALFVVKERKSRRIILYLFLVYLLAIFFAAGTHPPLGFLYQVLVEKIPGFFVFRTPYYKFASALFFANAFILAFLIESIPQRIRKLAGIFLCAVVLGYHFPYFAGNFFEWRHGYSTRLSVPTYVFDFGNWLNTAGYKRVLLLPPDSPDLQYGVYQWGYLSFQALPTLLSNASVIVNNDKLNTQERTLTMALYNAILSQDKGRVTKLLSLLGISHVVLTRDAVSDVASSIPLDVSLYEKGMNATGLFTLEKQFGQWEVYAVNQKPQSKFYVITHNPAVIDGNIEDALFFLPQLTANNFVDKSELSNLSRVGVSQELIVPDCVSCPKKNLPVAIFPERNILPGDPFYSLVLFSEQIRSKPKDPKGAIYNTLGMTLKRASEINQMMFEKKILTKDVADRYIGLLRSIKEDFGRLTFLKDKIDIARDIEFYMRAERNLLRPNLGSSITSGSQTVLSGDIFSAISNVDAFLDPYVVTAEDSGSRLYQWNNESPGNFKFFVEEGDLKSSSGDLSAVRMSIDNSVDLKPTGGESQNNQIFLGTANVDKGLHTAKLTLPARVEASYALSPMQTEFTRNGENNCFGAVIQGASHERLYLMRLRYLNDFSDNLILFVWERAIDGQNRLVSAIKLLAGPLEDKKEQILEPSIGTTEITIAACAPNLTNLRATKQLTLTLGEVVNPEVVVSSAESQVETTQDVAFTSEKPTRYKVTIANASPAILVFSQQFDPWWQLQGVDAKHILVNGYANGWLIDAPVNNPLIIEYKGQKYFYIGLSISLAVILGGIVILYKTLRTK